MAILLVGAAVGWTAHRTLSEVGRLNVELSRQTIESYSTADLFRADLAALQYALLRLQHDPRPDQWEQFMQRSQRLNNWIDLQIPKLRTREEKQLLDAMNAAYDVFENAARRLSTNLVAAADPAAFLPVEREASRLLELNAQLLEAHRHSLARFLEQSQNSLKALRAQVVGALVLLMALGAVLAILVYRDLIAPLRVQLARSQELVARQEKLASLGVLAAGVAHEIRNPLTAIKARLFTQQKALRPGSPELDDSKVIGDEINRLEHIVKSVLQFARPEPPQLALLPVADLLRDVRDLFGQQLARQAIRIDIDVTSDARVRADARQLKQVVINLVQNAADSIGRGGVITLRCRTEQRALGVQGGLAVVLDVQDTGRGIPPEVEKRLFDPFFTTKDGGTGLGLAIASRIVEAHGGALAFETRVNQGTTFNILLPAIPT
jgi:signal transduction histidine kinase